MVFNFKYCAYFRESLLFSQDNKVIFIGLMRHQDLDEWNLLDEILVEWSRGFPIFDGMDWNRTFKSHLHTSAEFASEELAKSELHYGLIFVEWLEWVVPDHRKFSADDGLVLHKILPRPLRKINNYYYTINLPIFLITLNWPIKIRWESLLDIFKVKSKIFWGC